MILDVFVIEDFQTLITYHNMSNNSVVKEIFILSEVVRERPQIEIMISEDSESINMQNKRSKYKNMSTDWVDKKLCKYIDNQCMYITFIYYLYLTAGVLGLWSLAPLALHSISKVEYIRSRKNLQTVLSRISSMIGSKSKWNSAAYITAFALKQLKLEIKTNSVQDQSKMTRPSLDAERPEET